MAASEPAAATNENMLTTPGMGKRNHSTLSKRSAENNRVMKRFASHRSLNSAVEENLSDGEGLLTEDCYGVVLADAEPNRDDEHVQVELILGLSARAVAIVALNQRVEEEEQACIRRVSVAIVESTFFQGLILTLIVLNSITISLDSPDLQHVTELQTVLGVCEAFFVAVFTLEMLLKIVAMGLWWPKPTAYLRSAWNWFDGLIVLTALAHVLLPAFGVPTANLSALRLLRILRPLRTISTVQGMRAIVQTLIFSMPLLGDVFLLMLFLIAVFAILGVQLWSDTLHQRCYVNATRLWDEVFDPDRSGNNDNTSDTWIGSGNNDNTSDTCIGSGNNDTNGTTCTDTSNDTSTGDSTMSITDSLTIIDEYEYDEIFGDLPNRMVLPDWTFPAMSVFFAMYPEAEKHVLGNWTSMATAALAFSGIEPSDFEEEYGVVWMHDPFDDLPCSDLIGGRGCNDWATCETRLGLHHTRFINYDHMGSALLFVFKVVSLDDWPEDMWMVQDSYTIHVFFYFMLIVLVASYFSMNLFLAVLSSIFSDSSKVTSGKDAGKLTTVIDIFKRQTAGNTYRLLSPQNTYSILYRGTAKQKQPLILKGDVLESIRIRRRERAKRRRELDWKKRKREQDQLKKKLFSPPQQELKVDSPPETLRLASGGPMNGSSGQQIDTARTASGTNLAANLSDSGRATSPRRKRLRSATASPRGRKRRGSKPLSVPDLDADHVASREPRDGDAASSPGSPKLQSGSPRGRLAREGLEKQLKVAAQNQPTVATAHDPAPTPEPPSFSLPQRTSPSRRRSDPRWGSDAVFEASGSGSSGGAQPVHEKTRRSSSPASLQAFDIDRQMLHVPGRRGRAMRQRSMEEDTAISLSELRRNHGLSISDDQLSSGTAGFGLRSCQNSVTLAIPENNPDTYDLDIRSDMLMSSGHRRPSFHTCSTASSQGDVWDRPARDVVDGASEGRKSPCVDHGTHSHGSTASLCDNADRNDPESLEECSLSSFPTEDPLGPLGVRTPPEKPAARRIPLADLSPALPDHVQDTQPLALERGAQDSASSSPNQSTPQGQARRQQGSPETIPANETPVCDLLTYPSFSNIPKVASAPASQVSSPQWRDGRDGFCLSDSDFPVETRAAAMPMTKRLHMRHHDPNTTPERSTPPKAGKRGGDIAPLSPTQLETRRLLVSDADVTLDVSPMSAMDHPTEPLTSQRSDCCASARTVAMSPELQARVEAPGKQTPDEKPVPSHPQRNPLKALDLDRGTRGDNSAGALQVSNPTSERGDAQSSASAAPSHIRGILVPDPHGSRVSVTSTQRRAQFLEEDGTITPPARSLDPKGSHRSLRSGARHVPPQWQTLEGFNAFKDEDAIIMKCDTWQTEEEARRVCLRKGFGGFVVKEGIAYLRKQHSEACRKNLRDAPDCTFHLVSYWESHEGKGCFEDRPPALRLEVGDNIDVCVKECLRAGYGGFSIKDGIASFRIESPRHLRQSLRAYHDCDFYTRSSGRTTSDAVKGCMEACVVHPKFEQFMLIVTVANVVALGADHHNIPLELAYTIEAVNLFCSVCFTAEIAMKFVGMGVRRTLKDGFNRFDFMLVLIGIPQLVLTFISYSSGESSKGNIFSAFRLLRVARVLRLGRRWTRLRKIIKIVISSLGSVAYLSLLLLLMMFVYGVMGMQLFGDDSTDSPSRLTFKSLFASLLTVFVVVTGEGWSKAMVATMENSGWPAAFFFISLFVVGRYIFLNLFIAIIIERFNRDDTTSRYTGAQSSRASEMNTNADDDMAYMDGSEQPNGNDGKGNGKDTLAIEMSTAMAKDADAGADEGKPGVNWNDDEDVFEESEDEEEIEDHSDFSDWDPGKDLGFTTNLGQGEMSPNAHKGSPRSFSVNAVTWNEVPGNKKKKKKHKKRLASRAAPPKLSPAWFGHSTCGIFSHTGCIRRYLTPICTSPTTEKLIVAMIVLNLMFLAFESPETEDDYKDVFLYADIVFSALYFLEMVMKLIVFGAYQTEHAYLKDLWNAVDVFIVATSILGFLVPFFTLFRSFRVFRLITKSEHAKVVLYAAIGSVPSIMNGLVVSGFVFILFAITGVQLLQGKLVHCSNPDETIHFKEDCENSWYIDPTTGFNETGQWRTNDSNFNHLGEALFTLFKVALSEQWNIIMFESMDSVSETETNRENNQPAMAIFFILFFVIANFLCLNLIISILINSFSVFHEARFIQDHGENYLATKFGGWEADTSRYDIVRHNLLTEDQRKWVRSQKLLAKDVYVFTVPKNKYRRYIHECVLSPKFEYSVAVVIVLNLLLLCTQHRGQSDEYIFIFDTINNVFILFYVGEFMMKALGFGLKQYWRDGWNKFDFIVLIVSIIGVLVGQSLMFFRVFRIGRLLRLFHLSKGLSKMFTALLYSLPHLFNIGLLLCCVFFVFGIIGVKLYGKLLLHLNPHLGRNLNFSTLPHSVLLLFQISTGEMWLDVLKGLRVREPHCREPNCGTDWAIPYLVLFMIVVSFLMVNLFVAVVLEAFQDAGEVLNDDSLVRNIHDFRRGWLIANKNAKDDPDEMPVDRFIELISNTPPPLGPDFKKSKTQLLQVISDLNIPLDASLRVYYRDVVAALQRRSFNITKDSAIQLSHFSQVKVARDDETFTIAHYYCVRRITDIWKAHFKARYERRLLMEAEEEEEGEWEEYEEEEEPEDDGPTGVESIFSPYTTMTIPVTMYTDDGLSEDGAPHGRLVAQNSMLRGSHYSLAQIRRMTSDPKLTRMVSASDLPERRRNAPPQHHPGQQSRGLHGRGRRVDPIPTSSHNLSAVAIDVRSDTSQSQCA